MTAMLKDKDFRPHAKANAHPVNALEEQLLYNFRQKDTHYMFYSEDHHK